MVDETENWSSSWNSSQKPSKQRKYRENAPLHVKDNLVSSHLDSELREELGTRNIKLRTGDRVKVMRGDKAGAEGIVNNIDRENLKVYIDGVDNERQDGSTSQKAFDASNLQIVALNVEDEKRLEKYEVENLGDIKVEEEEVEEALEEDEENEMMQRMKDEDGQEEDLDDIEDVDERLEPTKEEIDTEAEEETGTEESEEDEATETSDDSDSAEYEEIVSGTISDAKDQISDMEDPDYDSLIEAEKSNKERKTMIEWLERQKE